MGQVWLFSGESGANPVTAGIGTAGKWKDTFVAIWSGHDVCGARNKDLGGGSADYDGSSTLLANGFLLVCAIADR